MSVPCCDLHNHHCEPPSELCCWQCSEADHPRHPPGIACTWLPLGPAGDSPGKPALSPSPCPVCAVPGGFHDDGPHADARTRIPEHLVRPSNNEVRRERRAHEHVVTAPDLALAESDPAGFVLAVARVAELEAQTEEELRRGSTYWSGNECLQHERRWTPAQALVAVRHWRGVVHRHRPLPDDSRICNNGCPGRYPCDDLAEVTDQARAYLGGAP